MSHFIQDAYSVFIALIKCNSYLSLKLQYRNIQLGLLLQYAACWYVYVIFEEGIFGQRWCEFCQRPVSGYSLFP